MQPTEAAIRERSYLIWEREGCPEGRAWDHWFRAEAELRAGVDNVVDSKRRSGRTAGAKSKTVRSGKTGAMKATVVLPLT